MAAAKREPRVGDGFGRLWSASTASNFGDGVARVAIALLAVRLTKDPFAVSVISALSFLPWLLGIPAGALVDRHDRRRLAVVAGSIRVAAFAVLVGAVATDRASLWLLYGVVLVLGMCETVYDNAVTSMVPMVARRDRLERATGRLQGAQLVAQTFVAPPLAAAVFALSATAAFGVTVGSYAFGILLLLTLPGRFKAAAGEAGASTGRGPSIRTEMAEGVWYVFSSPMHRRIIALVTMLSATTILSSAVSALWAREHLGVSEAAFGVFILGGAAGGLVGSLTAARIAERIGRGRLFLMCVLTVACGLFGSGLTRSAYLAGLAFVLIGWGSVAWNVVGGALRMRITPEPLLGRTIGAYRTITWGTSPIAAVLGGVIAGRWGLPAPFLVSGAALFLVALYTARSLTTARIDATIAAADTDAASAADRRLTATLAGSSTGYDV